MDLTNANPPTAAIDDLWSTVLVDCVQCAGIRDDVGFRGGCARDSTLGLRSAQGPFASPIIRTPDASLMKHTDDHLMVLLLQLRLINQKIPT